MLVTAMHISPTVPSNIRRRARGQGKAEKDRGSPEAPGYVPRRSEVQRRSQSDLG